jgi:very-short-patch-repair endonuclease
MRNRTTSESIIRDVPIDGVDAARELRRRSTPAERALWAALRGRQLNGMKFRRQHAVGRYVLDFWCPEHKLVVELDGGVHDRSDVVASDIDRMEHLAAYGYRVIRFRNDEVFNSLESVLQRISAATASSRSPPLPKLGEGVGG